MNDDWRLQITLHEREDANTLADDLAASVLERELIESLHDRVIVSRDEAEVFCYTGTREQAEAAEVDDPRDRGEARVGAGLRAHALASDCRGWRTRTSRSRQATPSARRSTPR